MCGVEFLDLPCLASGHDSNLTFEDMAGLQRRGISVDNDNSTSPQNIPVPGNIPLTQL